MAEDMDDRDLKLGKESVDMSGDANLNLEGWPGQTIHQASIYDNTELLECLLQGEEIQHINSTDFANRTPLYTAVSNGSCKALRLLLEYGADPDITGGTRTGYMTPLHLAVTDNKIEAVNLLVGKANLSVKDLEGYTPLGLAVAMENSEIMQIITKEMAERVQRLHLDTQEFREACESGDIEQVQKSIARTKYNGTLSGIINNTSGNLYTPLSIASRFGFSEITQLLIENGADVTPQPLTNETPLHIACEFGHTKVVLLLLEKFQDVAAMATTDCELPIHIAAQKGNEEIVRLLLTFPYPENHLNSYRHQGRIYKAAFDINAKDMREMTPLLYAARKGHTNLVRYLVLEYKVSSKPEAGSSTDKSKQRIGSTLGTYSISHSRRIRQNLSRVSTRKRPTPNSETADDPINICPMDLEFCDQDGCSALFVAIQQDNSPMVEILLKAGCDPNNTCFVGHSQVSPLMMAAREKRLPLIELLQKFGARDDDNEVFNIAIEIKDQELLAALLRLKCRNDIENTINKKAMMSEYQKLYQNAPMIASCEMDSIAIFPTSAVSIEWQNLKRLKTVEEMWVRRMVIRLHSQIPNLKIDPQFALYAVTNVDISGNCIKELPGFLFKLPSLQYLNASCNVISHIQFNDDSAEIDCPVLSRLFLHHNELVTVPDFVFQLPSIVTLDVSSNNIVSLNESMWTSHSLRELNLSHNQLRQLPSFINEQFSGLRSPLPSETSSSGSPGNSERVDKSHSSVLQSDEMSPKFVFPTLERAEGVNPDVMDAELNHDVIWRKKITVAKERSQSVKGIEILNLSYNLFTHVPAGLACLAPHLTYLNLAGNQLICVGLPNWYPTSITQLVLNNNNIRSVLPDKADTEAFQQFFCYKWVDSDGRPKTPDKRPRMSSVSSNISLPVKPQAGLCHHRQQIRFVSLEDLNLSSNCLPSVQLVVPSASSPSKSGSEEANNSKRLGRVADIDLLFPSLTVLDLGFNKIRGLPASIGEMTTLKSLCLSNNQIKDLPPGMGLLKRLWQLNLENCPLEGPLREMVENKSRPSEIISFLDSIREESTHYNCMNLIFVGQHDIGKTSLLQLMRRETKIPKSGVLPRDHGVNFAKKLLSKRNRCEEKALHWTERTSKTGVKPKQKKGSKLLSTVGIDINELILEKKGREVTFRTWDFGGQKEYYATHQYFLSTRALYLVIWNMVGKSGMKSIWEWLINIQARAPGAAVIIVGTHLDVLKDKKTASSYPDDYESEMMEKLYEIKNMVEPEKYGLPNVLDVRNVSCKTEENVRQLVSSVYDCALQLKHPRIKTQNLLGQKIPRKYLLLQKIVTDLAQTRKAEQRDPVLDANLYKVLVMNQMTEVCGEVFRDMAELDQATRFLHENGVLCHYEDSSLRDLYFLDPQWLCDQLARVVTIQDVNRYAVNGVMKISDLALSFKDTTFKPHDIKQYFINLLEKFEVALQFDSQNLLIPSMLAGEHDPKLWVNIPVRQSFEDHVSIHQEQRKTLFTEGIGAPIRNIGGSKFYLPRSVSREKPESRTAQVQNTQIEENVAGVDNSSINFSYKPCQAFSLYRLYFMTYFPSGFWPRLIIGLLGDSRIHDILTDMYEFPPDWTAADRTLKQTNPKWRCWKSGLDLIHHGNRILCVKEFDTDYPGMSCDYTRCQLMCPQEGDLRPISLEKSSLLEISVPNFSITVTENNSTDTDNNSSGSDSGKTITIHQNFKASAKLLTLVVDYIDTLLHDWFPDIGELRMAQSLDGHYLITRVVPCSKCINFQIKRNKKDKQKKQSAEWNLVEGSIEDVESVRTFRVGSPRRPGRTQSLTRPDSLLQGLNRTSKTPGADIAYCRSLTKERENCVYAFMVEECILSAKSGKCITCPTHGVISPLLILGPSQEVDKFHLAPDLVFADLPEELLIREDQVDVGKYLGHGAFGFVFAGILNKGEENEVEVGMKMLEPFDPGVALDEEHSRRLENQKRRWQEDPMHQCTEAYLMARQELGILQVTQHEHIIPFMGIALSPLSLILELAPMGSLDKLLKDRHQAQKRLPVYVVTHTAWQVASALKYLHLQKILYRDLKSDNALVFSFPTDEAPDVHVDVKLSDYGISRSILSSGVKGFGGTPPFIAPEVIQQGGKTTYCEKVDCFSFGMFLYELLTCQLPFMDHPMIINLNLHILQGGRPSISPETTRYPSYMLDLMTRCWAHEAKNRPSSDEIVDILSSPEFSHMMDAVSLEGNVSVGTACVLHVPAGHNAEEFLAESMAQSSLGLDGSYGGVKKGDSYSQVWLMTRTKQNINNGGNNHLEVFTYQQNKCEESQVIKVSSVMTSMTVVYGVVWCADNKGSVHIYCPETLESIYQFELPPWKEPCVAVAVLHAASSGEVIIALSNGHLLVYPDQPPINITQPLPHKEDIFCNGRRIFCATLVESEKGYEVWLGQEHGKIAIQSLVVKSSPTQISAVQPIDPNISCLFLVSDNNQSDSCNVWAYNYPGSVVHHWKRLHQESKPIVVASLDCSLLQPDRYVELTTDKLESVWCQVTAMNILGDYLYVGTTSGSLIVTNKLTMEPIHCFRCHANKEFYIKFLLPVCTFPPSIKNPQHPVSSPGILSVGKGFKNLFDKVEQNQDFQEELAQNAAHLTLDEAVSSSPRKLYRPRQDNTYLLSWLAIDWEDSFIDLGSLKVD